MTKTRAVPDLLLCDVGNSRIKFGLASRDGLLHDYSLPTDLQETADSLGLKIMALLAHARVEATKLAACVVASVVPGLDPVLKDALERYVSRTILYVPSELPIPLENRYPHPEETGADRLVGAYAARMLFPDEASLLIADFGTAVTFDCVSGSAYLGGLIFPGPSLAAAALGQKTAKLPAIGLELDSREPQPCVNTATSIRHGIIFGYQHLVEGLCCQLAKKLPSPVRIVATGAFALTLKELGNIFDAVVPSLVLDGLRNLYYTQIPEPA